MKKLSIANNAELQILLDGEPFIHVDKNFKYHNNYLKNVLQINETDTLDFIKSRIKQKVKPSAGIDFVMVYDSGAIDAYSFIVGGWEFEGDYIKVINCKTFYMQQFKIMDLAHAYTPSLFRLAQLKSIVELYNTQSLELDEIKKKLEYLESLVTNRTTNPPMFGRMYCDKIDDGTEEEINPKETFEQIKKDNVRDRELFTGCPLSKTKTITEEELKSITPVINYQSTVNEVQNVKTLHIPKV